MNAIAVCQDDCTHKECAKACLTAASDCVYCGDTIGFDRPYVELGVGPAHSSCVATVPFRAEVMGLGA